MKKEVRPTARRRSNSFTKRLFSNRTRRFPIFNPYVWSQFKRFSMSYSNLPPLSLKQKIPTFKIHKPPQLVRWDLIIMFLSELWGFVTSLVLPVFLRAPIYKLWAYSFKCNMEEMRDPLDHYKSLQEFFTRPLKDGMRPIESEGLASPVDGKVMTCGPVKNHIEKVKGQSYTLSHFLGSNYYSSKDQTEDEKLSSKNLYQIVIYLAPGDYHRIHSPVEWTCRKRRHFPGTLLPVAPLIGKIIPQLLAMNERVVLSGDWQHGFFSMTAVGAYNVGSIAIHFDDVRTNNVKRDYRCGNLQYFSWNGLGTHFYEKDYKNAVDLQRGEEAGLFRLGSTVVLIFEAPENFQFTVSPNQKIKMGQQLGHCVDHSINNQMSD